MKKPNYAEQTQELVEKTEEVLEMVKEVVGKTEEVLEKAKEVVEKTEKVPKRAKNDHVDWEKLARLSALIPVPDPKPYIYPNEPTWMVKLRYKDKY